MLISDQPADALNTLPKARLAIGFSGGGDSTALVHLCAGLKRKPLILIVDHALRDGSRAEAEQASQFAESLGLQTKILTWSHDGVTSGIQEKARCARYQLMGQACRDAGVLYLLTAHTRDDQAETLMMRYDRGTGWRGAAGMAKASSGKLWPELAHVKLLRPLLNVSRESLRAYNRKHKLSWIEDPSNKNTDFTRIRARQYLSGKPIIGDRLLAASQELRQGLEAEKKHLKSIADERLKIDDHGLIRVYETLPSRLWEFILRAASGTGGPIDAQKIQTLTSAIAKPDFSGMTLAGAYIVPDLSRICVGPDPSIYKGRHNKIALEPQLLEAGKPVIWDGRFKISTKLSGAIAMTSFEAEKAYPSIREPADQTNHSLVFNQPRVPFGGAIPIVIKEGEMVSNLGLRPSRGAQITSLVAGRLQEMLEPIK